MNEFSRPHDCFEQHELVALTKRFAESELKVPSGEKPSFHRTNFEKMGSLGLTGMSLLDSTGTQACPSLWIAAVLAELSRMQLGPAIYLSVHLMVTKLISQWSPSSSELAGLVEGKKLAAFCLTESQAGSDAANLSTRARVDGSDFVLSGEKIYITSGGEADLYLVFARTGESGAKGISAFLVSKSAPGIRFGVAEKKMGCEGAPICSVHFEECRIPQSARLGAEGEGYKIALSGLAGGRINIAAAACGLSIRAIELASFHLRERKQFGQALAEFQGLQFMLADMLIALEASVLLTRNAAEALDRGDAGSSPAIAKCFATDAAMKISTDAVQLLGGAGYLADYEVERLMRDAKMLQIVEGTNQIQRVLIARSELGKPKTSAS